MVLARIFAPAVERLKFPFGKHAQAAPLCRGLSHCSGELRVVIFHSQRKNHQRQNISNEINRDQQLTILQVLRTSKR